jgi:hypothetical protein
MVRSISSVKVLLDNQPQRRSAARSFSGGVLLGAPQAGDFSGAPKPGHRLGSLQEPQFFACDGGATGVCPITVASAIL